MLRQMLQSVWFLKRDMRSVWQQNWGTEILIHIGLNTVELNGEGFEKLVQEDDEVLAGQPLIRFDIDKIKEKGYILDVPIIISNAEGVDNLFITDEDQLKHGDYLFTVIK